MTHNLGLNLDKGRTLQLDMTITLQVVTSRFEISSYIKCHESLYQCILYLHVASTKIEVYWRSSFFFLQVPQVAIARVTGLRRTCVPLYIPLDGCVFLILQCWLKNTWLICDWLASISQCCARLWSGSIASSLRYVQFGPRREQRVRQ